MDAVLKSVLDAKPTITCCHFSGCMKGMMQSFPHRFRKLQKAAAEHFA